MTRGCACETQALEEDVERLSRANASLAEDLQRARRRAGPAASILSYLRALCCILRPLCTSRQCQELSAHCILCPHA